MKKLYCTLLLVLAILPVSYGQGILSVVDIRCMRLHPDNIPVSNEEVTLEGVEKIWAEQILKVVYGNGRWNNFSRDIQDPVNWKAAHPVLSSDGKWLFFAANIPGITRGWDILYSQNSSSGWGNPMLFGPEVNTDGDEDLPRWITKDMFTFSRNGMPVEAPIKASADVAAALSLSFTSIRMYQEVLNRKKEHVPLYLKTTMPLTESREQRVTVKYIPESNHVYSIQLGKFRHPDWLAVDQFKDLGDILLYEDNSGHLYIRLGPFGSLENANEAMNQIKRRKWFETAFIMYED
jgi:hypothetical protein